MKMSIRRLLHDSSWQIRGSVLCLVLCCCGIRTINAIEGTAFFCVQISETYQTHGIDGIWRVNASNGQKKQIFGQNDGSAIIDAAVLSWDGRRVFFRTGGRSYIMDNDGGNLSRHDNANNDAASWSRKGIHYGVQPFGGEATVYLYNPETQVQSVVLTSKGGYNATGARPVYPGGNGELTWARIAKAPSCGTDDYAYSYMHFSRTNQLLKMFAWRDWGHGEEISMCGRYMFHQYFTQHNGFWVRQTSDGNTLTHYRIGPIADVRASGGGNHEALEVKCTNNPDYFGMEIFRQATPRHSWFIAYNIKTDKSDGTLPNPVSGSNNVVHPRPGLFGFWHGNDLPAPNESRAYIVPLDNTVSFSVGGETSPVSKAVEIWNLGGGNMQAISAQVSAGAPWLSTKVNPLFGDRHYLLLEVDPSEMTTDSDQATVTLTSGNARNTRTITVYANKKRLPEPTHFKASKVAGTEAQVKFTWVDNAGAEDGYVIEYCTEVWANYDVTGNCFGNPGEYSNEIGRVGPNVTTFVKTGMTRTNHIQNHYRVRALGGSTYEGSLPSTGSKFFSSHSRAAADFSKADGWVTMVEPRQGFSYGAGNTMKISWISDGVANIKLDYSTDFGASWSTIAASISASNSLQQQYSWSVPATLDGKNIIVRAIDAGNPDIRSTRIAYVKDIAIGELAVSVRKPIRLDASSFSVMQQKGHVLIRHKTVTADVSTVTARLYGSNGRLIDTKPLIANGSTTFEVGKNGAGMYLVDIQSRDGSRFKKRLCLVQ